MNARRCFLVRHRDRPLKNSRSSQSSYKRSMLHLETLFPREALQQKHRPCILKGAAPFARRGLDTGEMMCLMMMNVWHSLVQRSRCAPALPARPLAPPAVQPNGLSSPPCISAPTARHVWNFIQGTKGQSS